MLEPRPRRRAELRTTPELRYFPPGEPSRIAWAWVHIRFAAMCAAPPILLAIATNALLRWAMTRFGLATLFGQSTGLTKLGVQATLVAVVWAPGLLTAWLLARFYPRAVRRWLRQRLRERGVPMCLACGHDAGARAERCPECGRPLRLPGRE